LRDGNRYFIISGAITFLIILIIYIIVGVNLLALPISACIGYPIAYLIIRKLNPDGFKK